MIGMIMSVTIISPDNSEKPMHTRDLALNTSPPVKKVKEFQQYS